MPTKKKKRKIPELVQAHLERRAQQNTTMAERHVAALGKSAREQLKPLLSPAVIPAFLVERQSVDLSALFEEQFKQMARSLLLPPNWLVFPTGRAKPLMYEPLVPPLPTIDASRLEALKNAEPYKPQIRIPDMVQVVTGWRGWKLKGGLLSGIAVESAWPAREALRAACKIGGPENHLAPHWNCQCGIWAFKDLDRLVAAIGDGYASIKVIGTVSLWGRVIETENGYRAQFGYPSELWLLDESLEELGLIYDVPIRR